MQQTRGRSPHGERGLKFCSVAVAADPNRSLPSRGAWIEIRRSRVKIVILLSLPSRGAWIEMVVSVLKYMCTIVAPLTGSVD